MTHLRILITGATGYIGGKLLHYLGQHHVGYIRCLTRNPQHLQAKFPHLTFDCIEGDARDKTTVEKACEDIDIVFYLIHSMGSSSSFEAIDRNIADTVANACKRAQVKRIIYLGGLGEHSASLSDHLSSRHEVGHVLRQSGVPVTEFRASIIIGQGSLSFDMIQALVNRLPIMIVPRWVQKRAQPIDVDTVILYLYHALFLDDSVHHTIDIGGPEIVSYVDIMYRYASIKGLKRLIIKTPFLTPWLSSLWLGLITPVYARIGRKLISSIKFDTIISNTAAKDLFPTIIPPSLDESLKKAITSTPPIPVKWSDSASSSFGTYHRIHRYTKPYIIETQHIDINATCADVFVPIQTIGGDNGWYYGQWLWVLRGWIDLLCGGIGLRRGRRDPNILAVGDALDWWRVVEINSPYYLELKAEMKVPGKAWLVFSLDPIQSGCRLTQKAIFKPKGVWGFIYWYSLYPIHLYLFTGLLKSLQKKTS